MPAYPKRRPVSTALRACLLLAPALLCCVLLSACASAPPPKAALESEDPDNVLWGYGEKALQLRFGAARDLNAFENKAHTLQVCVYQLDKRDAFDLLRGTPEGISSLLQCAPFDKSVKNATRIFLQPGETATHTLDRAEGALFVGVVCGYFVSTPEQSAKLWQIPPSETQTGFLFWKSTLYRAGKLALDLHLGAHAMAEDSGRKQAQEQKGKQAPVAAPAPAAEQAPASGQEQAQNPVQEGVQEEVQAQARVQAQKQVQKLGAIK
jgi:type VI secretion system VasD/TssJ family lipoprotein